MWQKGWENGPLDTELLEFLNFWENYEKPSTTREDEKSQKWCQISWSDNRTRVNSQSKWIKLGVTTSGMLDGNADGFSQWASLSFAGYLFNHLTVGCTGSEEIYSRGLRISVAVSSFSVEIIYANCKSILFEVAMATIKLSVGLTKIQLFIYNSVVFQFSSSNNRISWFLLS